MRIATLSCCGIRNCKQNSQIVSGIRILFADFTYILRIPPTFCGIHLQFRNPEQLAIFACCGIRKKNKWAGKLYVISICTRNPRNFCKWCPLTFWIIFKNLSLEYSNIQTQNCAPIQCTVWSRNVFWYFSDCSKFPSKNALINSKFTKSCTNTTQE